MRINKKIVSLMLLILACLILATGSFYFVSQKPRAKQAEPEGKAYTHLVTSKDQEPLPVSQQAVKNGRTLVVPILMYHHVGDLPTKANKVRQDLTVPTANFEAEVKWLSDNKYSSVTLEDIYLYSQGKFIMPKKPVVFTFDDGYEDVFINAVPILKKYNYTGSFGIITQNPGTSQGTNIYAPWEEIKNAQSQGNEIVSHTQNHFDGQNPKFTASYIFQNLSASISDIYNNLGTTTNILIYPYGHYTDSYITQAKKSGFVMGVTVHEGKLINLDDLMRIPRVRVHGQETLERFQKIITE
jgi:peptidoglycan/xylan/chitin deacetylase (PgdA/CDA1 family)